MRVKYDQYVRENRAKFVVEVLKQEESKLPFRRGRDDEEEKLLTHLDALRWKRALEERRITYLSGRVYKMSIEEVQKNRC